MKIQRLTPGEGGRLKGIRLRSLRDAPDSFGSTFEEKSALPDESWRKQLVDLATFVAVLEGGDVGIVRGSKCEETPGAAILISMWVAPEARGKGAGEALIDALVDWARSEGFVQLVLDVGDDNGPAIALYSRKGFEPSGETSTLPPLREHRRSLSL